MKTVKGIFAEAKIFTDDIEEYRFRTGYDLSDLEGTVLWICKSPFRKNHKRKNWYVDVSIIPDVDETVQDKKYRVEKFRCGSMKGRN